MNVVYIHNGILAVRKRNNAIWGNRDGPRASHTEWSKSDRQISYDTTYIWNLKDCSAYLQNRNRLADIENQLRLTQVERKHGGGIN